MATQQQTFDFAVKEQVVGGRSVSLAPASNKALSSKVSASKISAEERPSEERLPAVRACQVVPDLPTVTDRPVTRLIAPLLIAPLLIAPLLIARRYCGNCDRKWGASARLPNRIARPPFPPVVMPWIVCFLKGDCGSTGSPSG